MSRIISQNLCRYSVLSRYGRDGDAAFSDIFFELVCHFVFIFVNDFVMIEVFRYQVFKILENEK